MIPRKLIMKNFLSHTDSSINFDKFKTALILGSYNNNTDESNGAGKSAILEAIRWALFDKARHKKKDDIVKRDATSCMVQFEFEIDKTLYRITRKRNKVVGETDVSLEQWDGNKFGPIDCDTNTATDDKIVDIISFNHEVFTNSVYFRQGDISAFTKSTPSKRKDILKALLKLDKWDEYQKQAKKYASDLSLKIEERKNNVVDIKTLEYDIVECDKFIANVQSQIELNNANYVSINQELMGKKYELQSIPKDVDAHLIDLQREFKKVQHRLSEIKNAKKVNDDKINKISDELKDLEHKSKMLKDFLKDNKDVDLNTARNGLTKGYARVKFLKEQITQLQKELDSNACSHCLRPISAKEFKRIKDLRDQKLRLLKRDYEDISQKIKNSEIKFKELENKVAKCAEAEIKKNKIEAKLIALNGELQSLALNNQSLSMEESNILAQNTEQQINDIKDKFSKQKIEALQNQISIIELQASDLKNIIDNLNVDYGSKINVRDELLKKKDDQTKLQKELSSLNDDFRVYDKLRHLFGKDGVQSVIIENVVDELENYTNATLSKICNEPTSIDIQMQRQSESGSWTETFDIEVNLGNRQDDFEALSGGEQFRISLALRLALSKILSKRMGGEVKFLLLDEVSSSLDEKGLIMFANIVKQLGNEMKVLIITHDNSLKDYFDDVIMVEKDSSGSRANI